MDENTFSAHRTRQGYRPLQELRLLLVRLADELLDLMGREDEFKYFQFDGLACTPCHLSC